MTTLLCLLVILLESLICRFVKFPPDPPSLSVEKRVSDYTGPDRPRCLWHSGDSQSACFLSLEWRGVAYSSMFFVNKPFKSLGSLYFFAPITAMSSGKAIGRGKPWEQRWHQSWCRVPSERRSRSQLRRAVSGWWDTTRRCGRGRRWGHLRGPSFMKLMMLLLASREESPSPQPQIPH